MSKPLLPRVFVTDDDRNDPEFANLPVQTIFALKLVRAASTELLAEALDKGSQAHRAIRAKLGARVDKKWLERNLAEELWERGDISEQSYRELVG